MAAATKLTPRTVARVEEALAKGCTYRLAALYAGIAETTLHEWRRTKPEFAQRLSRVEAEGAVTLLDIVDRAAREDWRAAAWKLERRYPQEYGRTVQEVQGRDGGAIQQATAVEIRYVNDWRSLPAPDLPELAGGPAVPSPDGATVHD